MRYIPADKLIAEIERMKKELFEIGGDTFENKWACGSLDSIKAFVISLQQEQPEKSKKDCNVCPHCVDRKDQYGWHFKGCFGGPYNGKFIAEIDECPLKQEQPEVDLITEYDEQFDSDPVYGKLANRNAGIVIARHFFELGRTAK